MSDNNFCIKCGNILQKSCNTKKQEIVLRVINCVLIIPIYFFLYSFVLEFMNIISVGSVDSKFFVIENFGVVSFIAFIDMLVLVFFNIFSVIKMYKNNKYHKSIIKHKKVNKLVYILIAFLFGKYGVHRFIVNDIKNGFFYLFFDYFLTLFIFILSFLVPILLSLIGLPFFIEIAFVLSDIVIGFSKQSDTDKMIYV